MHKGQEGKKTTLFVKKHNYLRVDCNESKIHTVISKSVLSNWVVSSYMLAFKFR